jgi:flagellar secretion chaperone FliS
MGAHGYAQAYRDTALLTASPGRLVLMLFDGALKSMEIAREAFERPKTDFKRFETINRHLLKAQSILAELQGGVDLQEGGEFARTMHSLYNYHMRRLLEANMSKKPEPLIEVMGLVGELRDAWAQMLSKGDCSQDPGIRNVA